MMSIHHVWSVLCTHPLTDAATNNVSLVNVTEQLNCRVFPALAPELTLMSLWERGNKDDALLRLSIRTPDGSDAGDQEWPVQFRGKKRARTAIQFNRLVITKPGRYAFLISVLESDEWKVVSEVPLDVQPIDELLLHGVAGEDEGAKYLQLIGGRVAPDLFGPRPTKRHGGKKKAKRKARPRPKSKPPA